MEIIQREIFGPVAPIVTFHDLEEAIAFANDSDYGLTSSIYTRDLNVALKACQEIRFGETYINRENFEAMQGFHAGWRKSGIAAPTASTASTSTPKPMSSTSSASESHVHFRYLHPATKT